MMDGLNDQLRRETAEADERARLLTAVQASYMDVNYALGMTVAQPPNWHQIAQRNTERSYGRLSNMLRDLDMPDQMRHSVLDAALRLTGAIQNFQGDMYLIAQEYLKLALAHMAGILDKLLNPT